MHNHLANQASLFRRGSPSPLWQHLQDRSPPSTSAAADPSRPLYSKLLGGEDPAVASLVPSVTVALEGRSICHRIDLHSHSGYPSLARALRRMFGYSCGGLHRDDEGGPTAAAEEEVELGNAVPGHLVAYEDLENDLLLAGDLSWKDFVRVAKRIRIMPVKPRCKRPRTTS